MTKHDSPRAESTPPRSPLTTRLDYLQRVAPTQDLLSGTLTSADPDSIALLHVTRIGRPGKASNEASSGVWTQGRAPSTAAPGRRERSGGAGGAPLVEMFAGLHGRGYPLAMVVQSDGLSLDFRLGTWSVRSGTGANIVSNRIASMHALLEAAYPVVEMGHEKRPLIRLDRAGYAVGSPALRSLDDDERVTPLDRIARGLRGYRWRILLLAQPVPEWARADQRNQLLNELRVVSQTAQSEGAPSPLTDHYSDLVSSNLQTIMDGGVVGNWRTAVYLAGDDRSFPLLSALWRGTFGSVAAAPEPVQVFEHPAVTELAGRWAMPDAPGAAGPGYYSRMFAAQSLLSSEQLGTYVHFPEHETPGFAVDLAPRFDTVVRTPSGPAVDIGEIMHHRRGSGVRYAVAAPDLTRHLLISGLTGGGKTNTLLHVLSQVHAAGVPFLVIEPAKTEYRGLLRHPAIGPHLQVITVGREDISPLRLNPFEVGPGIPVAAHLDLIRSAFDASFGMWPPLPQVVERCLHEIYTERGWDLRSNTNRRLPTGADPSAAFPTLSDLVAKVHEVVPSLGYEDRITGDIRAALVTRLDSLRTGAKGAMLDVARSVSLPDVFQRPTVIELEALGEEGDKALIMALLLIRLVEHRRAAGPSANLEHVLVVEEAHRLLANVPVAPGGDFGNPRGHAVETFTNLLSEIRAYGQGVVIADQVPVRLAPDAVKNTSLKIAHRIVSDDDRAVLAGAMNMDEVQQRGLVTLGAGEAIVSGAGDDTPVLVRVPLVKEAMDAAPPTDTEILRLRPVAVDAVSRPSCAPVCRTDPAVCDHARQIVSQRPVQRALSRLAVSGLSEAGAFLRLWPETRDVLAPLIPQYLDLTTALAAIATHGAWWWSERRGAQAGWSYPDTAPVGELLAVTLQALVADDAPDPDVTRQLRERVQSLQLRRADPFAGCSAICGPVPGACDYRSAAADLVRSGRFASAWRAADQDDAQGDGGRDATWEVAQDAGFELIEFPGPGGDQDVDADLVEPARRAALCFGQQQLLTDPTKTARTMRIAVNRLLHSAIGSP